MHSRSNGVRRFALAFAVVSLAMTHCSTALATAKTFTVRPGDCLSNIAFHFLRGKSETSTERVHELNPFIKDPHRIRPGQRLQLPAEGRRKNVIGLPPLCFRLPTPEPPPRKIAEEVPTPEPTPEPTPAPTPECPLCPTPVPTEAPVEEKKSRLGVSLRVVPQIQGIFFEQVSNPSYAFQSGMLSVLLGTRIELSPRWALDQTLDIPVTTLAKSRSVVPKPLRVTLDLQRHFGANTRRGLWVGVGYRYFTQTGSSRLFGYSDLSGLSLSLTQVWPTSASQEWSLGISGGLIDGGSSSITLSNHHFGAEANWRRSEPWWMCSGVRALVGVERLSSSFINGSFTQDVVRGGFGCEF